MSIASLRSLFSRLWEGGGRGVEVWPAARDLQWWWWWWWAAGGSWRSMRLVSAELREIEETRKSSFSSDVNVLWFLFDGWWLPMSRVS